ncbi:MAG TPA: hypothetical protein VGJ96_03570 [Gemmatimonadaceae bacterium]|jgi:hypothetical protein
MEAGLAKSLSSRSTFTYKVLLPVLVMGSMIVGGASPYILGLDSPHMHLNGLSPTAFLLMMLVGAIPVLAILWVTVVPLKHVVLDDDELIISNFRYEIRVPLSAVRAIDGPSFTNPKTYTIKFESPTEFGDAVMFLPPTTWSLLPTEADEVAELRSAWEAARRTR